MKGWGRGLPTSYPRYVATHKSRYKTIDQGKKMPRFGSECVYLIGSPARKENLNPWGGRVSGYAKKLVVMLRLPLPGPLNVVGDPASGGSVQKKFFALVFSLKGEGQLA